MKTKFQDMLSAAKERDEFWVERAILAITEEIVCLMDKQGISKSELAKRLEKNPSFVTKLLSGENNFTLETLVKIGRRLDCEFLSHFQQRSVKTEWMDFLVCEPAREIPAVDFSDKTTNYVSICEVRDETLEAAA